MALPLLVGAPLIWLRHAAGTCAARRRATCAERECYAAFNGALAETVEGARTVEALRLGQPPDRAASSEDLADAYAAERYTLRLRTVWFPTMELAYALPVVGRPALGRLAGRPTATPTSARSPR